jgi:hypothetical protein
MKKSQSICHRKFPKFDTVVTPETEDSKFGSSERGATAARENLVGR